MKTILLVEDDQKIALAIGMRLGSMGYSVVTASDAVGAVSQARRCKPDVIVLDVNLPGGSGFLVAERLHKIVDTAVVPIVFITASKQAGLKERAEELSAVHLLEKPFSANQLVKAIESAINLPDDWEMMFSAV